MSNRYAQIEYRIHWGENNESYDINFLEGKKWRTVKKIIKECEQGIDEPDAGGYRIQWIERVERWFEKVFCQNGIGEWVYSEEQDYETLWERGD
jgi:hypothetical protein